MSSADWRRWRQAFFRRPSLAEISPWLVELRGLYVHVRQPILPFSWRELRARLGLGLTVAFWITLPATFIAATHVGSAWGLVGLVIGFPIAMAGAAAVSLVHTIVLRLLPLRGFAMSVLVSISIAMLVVHQQPTMSAEGKSWTLLLLGTYGIVIGVIGSPDERAKSRARPSR